MLDIRNISKAYGEDIILHSVSFSLKKGEVAAIIGDNGAGKTTLLNIIAGVATADSGKIIPSGRIGYVPQEVEAEGKVADYFYPDCEEWMMHRALGDVGLDEGIAEKAIHELSGGQKTRLAFAKVLAGDAPPDVLLLDEPTNNLDSEGILWLHDFVKGFSGSVLVASHDRMFINVVASKVLTLEDGDIRSYSGNYEDYKRQQDLERATAQIKYDKYVAEKKRLMNLRAKKTSQMNKVSSRKYDPNAGIPRMFWGNMKDTATKNAGRGITSLGARIEKLEKAEKPFETKAYRVGLEGETVSRKLLLRIDNVTKAYEKELLKDVSFEIRGQDRIRIAGLNGSGKTTLLKIAASIISPDSGSITLGDGVSVGYFSQDSSSLNKDITVLDNLSLVSSDTEAIYQECRNIGFIIDDLRKKPTELSRGQQVKIEFARLLLGRNDLLILDEPTNHLAISAREQIESALQRYKGAILVASHDEYFLRSINVTDGIVLD